MRYDYHITRARYWPESAQQPIHEQEWLRLVHADPALSIDGPHHHPRAVPSAKHVVAWPEGGDYTCFCYVAGRITCPDATKAWLAKMDELAQQLNAHIQSDTGDRYGEAAAPPPPSSAAERASSRQWITSVLAIAIVGLLGAVALWDMRYFAVTWAGIFVVPLFVIALLNVVRRPRIFRELPPQILEALKDRDWVKGQRRRVAARQAIPYVLAMAMLIAAVRVAPDRPWVSVGLAAMSVAVVGLTLAGLLRRETASLRRLTSELESAETHTPGG